MGEGCPVNPNSRKQQVVGEEGSPLRGYTYCIGLAIFAVAEYALNIPTYSEYAVHADDAHPIRKNGIFGWYLGLFSYY